MQIMGKEEKILTISLFPLPYMQTFFFVTEMTVFVENSM